MAEIRRPLAYQAVASAGRFGSVGVSAGLFESGVYATLVAGVDIQSDEFVNGTGVPQRATAHFVIDGGSMLMVSGRNSLIQYSLTLTANNLDSMTESSFVSFGILQADDVGSLSFVTTGENIGSNFDPVTGRVEIPVSFQSLDLGIMNPNDRLALLYQFDFLLAIGSSIGHPGSSEGLGARFSDPFNLSSNSVLGTIQLQPAAPVPEPSPSALLTPVGVLLLLGMYRRHRASSTPR